MEKGKRIMAKLPVTKVAKSEGIEELSSVIATRVTKGFDAKMVELASETNRTKGQVIRLLVEHGYSAYLQGYLKL